MINIIISSDQRYSINKEQIKDSAISALQKNGVSSGNVEIGISIVGDRKMHDLNLKYKGIDATTDILTFALEDPNPTPMQNVPKVGFVKSPDKVLRLGDIVISYPQSVEDAGLDGISVDEEIRLLVIHGVDHLLGIHHN